MTEAPQRELKRRGGRWVYVDHVEKDRAWKKIVGRLWYLLVPMVGVLCAQDSYVRPKLMENQNRINRSATALVAFTDSLQGEIRKVETTEINITTDVADNFQPQIDLYESILDSLRQERSQYDQTLPSLRVRADSLRAVLAELQGTLQQSTVDIQQRQADIDSLKEYRTVLRDSIGVVSEDLVVLSDTYDRLANPDKYRKNTALVPGPGNFPDRDNLPRR